MTANGAAWISRPARLLWASSEPLLADCSHGHSSLTWFGGGTVAFVAATLCGGFPLLLQATVFRTNGDDVAKRPLRVALSLSIYGAIVGALIGGFIGVAVPKGGLLLSLKFSGIMAAVGTLVFAIGAALGLVVAKVAPRRAGAVVVSTLLGCSVGSQLWRAWLEVGWFNLGIPVVGIPMAFAFFIMDQTRQGTDRS